MLAENSNTSFECLNDTKAVFVLKSIDITSRIVDVIIVSLYNLVVYNYLGENMKNIIYLVLGFAAMATEAPQDEKVDLTAIKAGLRKTTMQTPAVTEASFERFRGKRSTRESE